MMSWIRKWTTSKKHLSWRYIVNACEQLAEQIHNTNNQPAHLIALARGGLIPGTIMANLLDIRHVYSMGLSSYVPSVKGGETQQQFDIYQQLDSNSRRIKSSDRVLIVDDISDRGTTFEHVTTMINRTYDARVDTMSIIMKPGTRHVPTYYHETINSNKWVVFPWEKK